MSKPATITATLYAIFDKFADPAAFTVDMARVAAQAHGLNTTSAEISFYRWRMLRGFYSRRSAPMAH